MKASAFALLLFTALLPDVEAGGGDFLLAPGDGRPQVFHSNTRHPEGKFESPTGSTWLITPPPRTDKGANTMRIVVPVQADVRKGDQLVLECSVRAVDVQGGAAGQAGLVLDVAPESFDTSKTPPSIFRHIFLAGPDRETFRIPFEAPCDLAAGQWRIVLSPSFFEQPVELGGLGIRRPAPGEVTAPALSYPGQEADAAWRREARERIKRHRMGDLAVRVVDTLGKPIPGARLRLRQTRHAYLFGTCVVASRVTDAEVSFRDPEMTREKFLADNIIYREQIQKLFNFAVLENDLKWPLWIGEKPNFTQRATLDALSWLRMRGLATKGHTLVWASWRNTPGWLRELEGDPAALQAAIVRHIRDVGSATAALTDYWDVLNEPMSHRDIIELLGHENVAGWFRAAREVLPGKKLVLNDFDIVGNGGNAKRREGIISLVQDLKKLGGAPDIIGFQSHFWSDRLTPPEKIWSIIDEIHSATDLPVMASEFDMNFPNDRVQADYTRDFLTAWFAHPATDAFIMWGFWGGAHWFGERGAMFKTDWTPKPNLQAYTDLVFKEWWTSADGVADASGRWNARGFLGDYDLIVEADGHAPAFRRLSLARDAAPLEIVLGPRKSN